MGWWDAGIMGGDTTWDVAGCVGDVLEPDCDDRDKFDGYHMPDDWNKKQQRAIRKRFEAAGGFSAVVDALFDGPYSQPHSSDDLPIVVQVVGLMAMSCGLALSSTDRARIVGMCDTDPYRGAPDRRACLDVFSEAVGAYVDGTPLTIEQHGLFEKMDEAFNGADD